MSDWLSGLFSQGMQAADMPWAENAAATGAPDPLAGMFQQPFTNTPGSTLDTRLSDEDRAAQQQLIAVLQAQAQNGNPVAIKQLRDATARSQQTAMALGQSQPGVGYQTALRNIGNAQGADQQREAGQEAILKAQGQLSAQDQLAQLLGGQSSQDLLQSQAAQQAAQGEHQLEIATSANARQANANYASGVGKGLAAAAMAASSGGVVPGKAEFGGDDPRNDTVTAKLSPKEVVIPRSIMLGPDPVGEGAKFIAAHIHEARPKRNFDGGGQVQTAADLPQTTVGDRIEWNLTGMPPQAPSAQNGGLMDLSQYNQDRDQTQALLAMLSQRAAGVGPSTVAQELQGSTDAGIGSAMQAGANARQNPALLSAIMGGAGAKQQQFAGEAGNAKLQDIARGQGELGSLGQMLRGQDIGAEQAAQKAAFANTEMNFGLSLAQQQALMGLEGAAGQAAVAAADMGMRSSGPAPGFNTPQDVTNSSENYAPGGTDWSTPDGAASEPGTPSWAAASGGEVPDAAQTRDFVHLLMTKQKDDQDGRQDYGKVLAMEKRHKAKRADIERMLKRARS